MKILQKEIKGKEESFWYEGKIAEIVKPEGNYTLLACGEIRVVFKDGEDSFRDSNAVEEADRRGYTDENIKDWEFINNNWFEVVLYRNGKLYDCEMGDVCFTYAEGLEMLKHYAKDRHYKEQRENVFA